MNAESIQVIPSASRLTASLRDIGYDFVTALADVVDNSVTAGATHVDIRIEFRGDESFVLVADDGAGMTAGALNEALRFGSRRTYSKRDLGKFGLGLKTASLSQCTKVTVLSRAAREHRRIECRVLDLAHIESTDRWEILAPLVDQIPEEYVAFLGRSPGTVVVWELLDRVLTYTDPDGYWAKRKLHALARESTQYLGMVFHRFLAGEAGGRTLKITINGEIVQPWDPYGREEPAQVTLSPLVFELRVGKKVGFVRMSSYILPVRDQFSSLSAFERLSGPLKWNRQQGLYLYRAGRMIQHGGWCGIRTLDEHTKLARVAIDFDPCLDDLFQVNVAKMKVTMPTELAGLIEKPVSDVCLQADRAYRAGAIVGADAIENPVTPATGGSTKVIGFALKAASLELNEQAAFERIVELVRSRSPEVVESLGW